MAKQVDRLAAFSVEAQRRGVSYGQLMARTTPEERDRIAAAFRPQKRKSPGRSSMQEKRNAGLELWTAKDYL